MDEPEIAVNLGYVIDEGTGYAYCLLGRGYALSGTDDEDFNITQNLKRS